MRAGLSVMDSWCNRTKTGEAERETDYLTAAVWRACERGGVFLESRWRSCGVYRLGLEGAVRGEHRRGFEAPLHVVLCDIFFLTVVFWSLASLHRWAVFCLVSSVSVKPTKADGWLVFKKNLQCWIQLHLLQGSRVQWACQADLAGLDPNTITFLTFTR